MAGRPFSVLCDVDGVLCRGDRAIPSAARFVASLRRSGRAHVFVTNSAELSPRGLRGKLGRLGIEVEASHVYTAGDAIADFVADRARRPRVYAIGSRALKAALEAKGATLTERDPQFVVVTGGPVYGLREIQTAAKLVLGGAKLLAANREAQSVTEDGVGPGCGSFVAPIERATRCDAYVVGKPNHLMIRAIERRFGIDPARSLAVGDSLDTDIDVGIQAEMKTVLVLSGITTRESLARSPFRPDYVFPDVGHIRLERLP